MCVQVIPLGGTASPAAVRTAADALLFSVGGGQPILEYTGRGDLRMNLRCEAARDAVLLRGIYWPTEASHCKREVLHA